MGNNESKQRKARHSKGDFATVAQQRFPELIHDIQTLTPHIPGAQSKYQVFFCKRLTDDEKQSFQEYINDFFEVGSNWNHSDLVNWYNTVSPNAVEPGKSKAEYTVLLLTIF